MKSVTYFDMTFLPCKLSCDSTHLSLFYNVVSHKVYSHHLVPAVLYVDIYEHVIVTQAVVVLDVFSRDQLSSVDVDQHLLAVD